jgi:hypothetical protein
MPKPIHITTPRPTSEELAKEYRISKRRQKKLNTLAKQIVRQMQEEKDASASRDTGKGKKRKNAAAAA